MAAPSDAVREFFSAYAGATASLDSTFLEGAYAETFMFAGPSGTLAIKRDDFLMVVPKRRAFFDAAGWRSTELASLEARVLNEHYVQVTAQWMFRFEKGSSGPIVEPAAATYILRQAPDGLRIVFQLDHQDVTRRLQQLGLMPGASPASA